MLQAALSLVNAGYRIFPLQINGKKPVLEDWPNLATTNPEVVTKVWSARPYNIGVACGRGLLGVDIDMKHGKDGLAAANALHIPVDGFVVRTPTGGLHVYFDGPDVSNSANRLGDGLDVRSAGGYLVGPGSVIDGKVYTIEKAGQRLPAPGALVGTLQRPLERQSSIPLVVLDREDTVERARNYLEHEAATAVEGQAGDLTTFKVAAALKDIGVSETTAAELMVAHWNERCSPPWAYEDLRQKVANAYAYGSLPPGISHPEVDFAGVHVEPPTKEHVNRRWFRHGDHFELNAHWLYYELLPTVGVAMVVAPSQAGKTFLLIEMARSLATGKPFFNVTPDEPGATLFVFAGTEGSDFAKRILALQEEQPLPISATLLSGSLTDKDALTNLLADLKDEAAYLKQTYGMPVRAIVFETLASSGLLSDENDNSEASRGIANLAQISFAMNALVITSHHPTKDGKGSRGAGAIVNNSDYVLEIYRNGRDQIREVELTKARGAEQRRLGTFTLLPVILGVDPRGREIRSLTVSQGAVMTKAAKQTPNSEALIKALGWALDEGGEIIDGVLAVEDKAVRAAFKDAKPGSKDPGNVSNAFKAALAACVEQGAVEKIQYGGAIYLRKKDFEHDD